MNKTIVSLLIGLTVVIFHAPSASAQAMDPGSGLSTPSPPRQDNAREEEWKSTASDPARESTPAVAQSWKSEVLFPLARLFGIAVILGALLWWIELPGLMQRQSWTDRTVIALVVIFSFAAASLMDVSDKALATLKDVTLIVVGFYFGSARSSIAGGDSGTQGGEQPRQGQQSQSDR